MPTGKPTGKPTKTGKPATRKRKETVNINDKSITYQDDGKEKKVPLNNKQVAEILYNKRLSLKCKNKKQKDFLNTIDENEITICIGPAGTGKSHLAFYKALELLVNENNQYQKIYLLTPPVEIGASLGFMPGDLHAKMSYYTYSMYYLIDKLIGKENREKLVELGILELLGIGFLRGVNIDNAILITDEAQNMSVKEFKTLSTRIGFNSKFIISGDIQQIDKFRNKGESGLYDFYQKIQNNPTKGINVFEFSKEDIVRNPMISQILDLYDKVDLLKSKNNGNGKEKIDPVCIAELEIQGLA